MTAAIDAGRTVELAVTASRPGAASLLLYPVDELTLANLGPPLIWYSFALNEPARIFVVRAPSDARYTLFLSTTAGAYAWRLTSAWSPFFDVRSGIVFGPQLALAGFVSM